MMDIGNFLFTLTYVGPAVIVAITLHEAAHGWAAWKLGDDTAYGLGRVSFNPARHIDPFGTVLLPSMLYLAGGFLFGWAKPVPVAFHRLRNPRYGMVLVALAGPVTNLLLALGSALLLNVVDALPAFAKEWATRTLSVSVVANVFLAVFNMLPLPPLDGGRVAVGLLPRPLALRLARVEQYGILILMGLLLLSFFGREIGVELNILSWLIVPPAGALIDLILGVAGVR